MERIRTCGQRLAKIVTKFNSSIENMGNKLTLKHVCLFAIVILAINLIPVFVVSFYNYPAADDYTYTFMAHEAYNESGNIFYAIIGALKSAVNAWHTWQGTFSSIFLMSLAPHVFGIELYSLVTFIMVFSFLIGTFTICSVALKKIFKVNLWGWMLIATWLSFFGILTIPSPVEAYYWYNGSVHYIFPFSVSLLLFSLVIMLDKVKSKRTQVLSVILSCVFAIYCGGSNYITALNTALALAMFIVFWAIKRNPVWKMVVYPFAFHMIAFFINIIAPGNSIRQRNFEQYSVPETILESFRQAFIHINMWTGMNFIAILLILPFIWLIAKNVKIKCAFPLLVLIASICFFATCFSPTLYSMKTPGEGRLQNIYYLTYLFLLVFNIFYVFAWISQKTCNFKTNGDVNLCDCISQYIKRKLGYIAFAVIVLFVLFYDIQLTSEHALNSLTSGEAAVYAQQQSRRIEMLEDDTTKVVALETLEEYPFLLYFTDITYDPEHWINVAVAKYYEKDAVYVS